MRNLFATILTMPRRESTDRRCGTVAREAAENWAIHKDSRQGAALAYYSIFSISPLIAIAIAIAGFFFGRDAVSGQVASSVKDLLGDTGANAIQAMLVDAGRPREGIIATSLGLGPLFFAAIGVVIQLKDALNIVWEAVPPQRTGIWSYILTYLLSFAGVLTLGFLLMVSLLVTTALVAAEKYAAPYMQPWLLPAGFVFHDLGSLRDDVQVATRCARRLAGCLAWSRCNRGAF
jgi:membrane protein